MKGRANTFTFVLASLVWFLFVFFVCVVVIYFKIKKAQKTPVAWSLLR